MNRLFGDTITHLLKLFIEGLPFLFHIFESCLPCAYNILSKIVSYFFTASLETGTIKGISPRLYLKESSNHFVFIW